MDSRQLASLPEDAVKRATACLQERADEDGKLTMSLEVIKRLLIIEFAKSPRPHSIADTLVAALRQLNLLVREKRGHYRLYTNKQLAQQKLRECGIILADASLRREAAARAMREQEEYVEVLRAKLAQAEVTLGAKRNLLDSAVQREQDLAGEFAHLVKQLGPAEVSII